MKVKKKQSEPDVEQQAGSKLGKEYIKAVFSSPCLFNFYTEYIIQKSRLDQAEAEIKIAGRSINNLRYAYNTTFMARVSFFFF